MRNLGHALLAGSLVSMALLLAAGCAGEPLRAQGTIVQGDRVWTDFAQRGSDQTVARFFIWPRKSQDGFREVVVHFPHIQDVGYRLESFTVDVIAEGVIKPLITFEPEYRWDAMRVSRIDNGVQVHVSDTGRVGESTMDLNFWMPEQLMAEHDIVVRVQFRTRHGEGSGELRLRDGKPVPLYATTRTDTPRSEGQRGARPPDGLARIVHVGGGQLAGAVVERMAELGVEVLSQPGPGEFPVSPDMAVIFDGAWLAGHYEDPEVHALLREVTSAGAPVLAIGEQTALLLEALREAGVSEFTPGRNPAQGNPPQAGMQLRRDGDHVYAAHLFSNTTEPEVLVDAITRWYEGGFE